MASKYANVAGLLATTPPSTRSFPAYSQGEKNVGAALVDLAATQMGQEASSAWLLIIWGAPSERS